MIKLLIAEDESDLADELIRSIDWAELDIEICGAAADGQEAYDMACALSPDIMILDINMPKMSGLEVLQKLRLGNSGIQVIILSGYSDFQYARQAMLLGAADYILKPCPYDEVKKALCKLKDVIRIGEEQKQQFDDMSERIKKENVFFKQKILFEILKGNLPPEAAFNTYGIGLRDSFVSVILFECKNEKIAHSIFPAVKKHFLSRFQAEAGVNGHRVFLIFRAGGQNEDKTRMDMHNTIIAIKKEISPLYNNIQVGIGNGVTGIENWNMSFLQAEATLEASAIFGNNSVFLYKDISPMLEIPWKYPEKQHKQIIQGLINADKAMTEKGLNEFFERMKKLPPRRHAVLSISFSLCFALYDLARENGLDCNSLFGKDLERFALAESGLNLDQLYVFFGEIIKDIAAGFSQKTTYSTIVNGAISYIKEHFREDISLTAIAQSVFISPSRLSTVFKKETGIGINNFVKKMRIEKACELLKDKSIKVFEIAWMAGFNEEKYFFYAFKKAMKTTPENYRKLHS